MSQALQFRILTTAGWLNRQQEDAADYLRLLVREYVEHYHRERNHQGLGNQLLHSPSPSIPDAAVRCRKRIGGLLNYYHREAA
jgi:hypothetical protein